jgi:two-component system NtrC family sensor kinase
MEQIKLQIERCAGITQAILKFGWQHEPQLQNVDLRTFIPQVTGMVAKKASVNGIEIVQDIAESTPPVHGDPGQFQQVLLNLLNNAMDAVMQLHGASGGSIFITTAPFNGRQTKIVVGDNGCGINAEDMKKIFSPVLYDEAGGQGHGAWSFGLLRHHQYHGRDHGGRERAEPRIDLHHRPAVGVILFDVQRDFREVNPPLKAALRWK